MVTVNLTDATANLSQLVERAATGEEIIIAKAGRPMARLVPLNRHTTPRPLGLLRGEVSIGDDFDAPLPKGLMRGFQGEGP